MWSGILLFSTDEILNWASENEFDAISMLFDGIYMYLVSAMYKNSMSDARVTLYICLKRRGLFVDELQRTCRTQALRLTVNIQFFKNRNGIQRNKNLLSSFCIFCWTCCLLSSVCPCNVKVNYKTVEVLILVLLVLLWNRGSDGDTYVWVDWPLQSSPDSLSSASSADPYSAGLSLGPLCRGG